MKAISLQSGSKGNCIYVESNETKILIDAGISGIQAQQRLAQFKIDIKSINGVLISHDHSDHTRCAGIYSRKFNIPIYTTPKTFAAARHKGFQGKLNKINYFAAGDVISIGDLKVETIATPHDGVDGVAFIADNNKHRLGVLTDLGHVFKGLSQTLQTLDGVFLESNYDPHMLANGPYPRFLQNRIRGDQGHLSNEQATSLLKQGQKHKLQWACLAHLSENNNTPHKALEVAQHHLGNNFPVETVSRFAVSKLYRLE